MTLETKLSRQQVSALRIITTDSPEGSRLAQLLNNACLIDNQAARKQCP